MEPKPVNSPSPKSACEVFKICHDDDPDGNKAGPGLEGSPDWCEIPRVAWPIKVRSKPLCKVDHDE